MRRCFDSPRPLQNKIGLAIAAVLESGQNFFRSLYNGGRHAGEARDVNALLGLFAPDAEENGRHGTDAIAAGYRASLPALAEVRYELARLVVEPRGGRTEVRGPFVISYRNDGKPGELRGEAVFELERRDGRPRIVRLNYRADAPQTSAPTPPAAPDRPSPTRTAWPS